MAESKKVKSGDVRTQKMSHEFQEKPQKPPQTRAITMMLVAVLVLQIFLVLPVLIGIWFVLSFDWADLLTNILAQGEEYLREKGESTTLDAVCDNTTGFFQWLFIEECPSD